MRMTRCLRPLSLLLLLLQHQADAQSAADMNRQIALGRAVKDVVLSPDGQSVAAVITDTTAAGGHAHLWLLQKGAAPRQITGAGADSPADDSNPVWEPDGRTIIYLEKVNGGAFIKRIDSRGARAETLALFRGDDSLRAEWNTAPAARAFAARGFALAPTGAIAVWATESPPKVDEAAHAGDQHVFGQSEPVRLYVVGDARPRQLAVPDNVRSVTWRADGHALLAVTEPASDDLGAPNRLWLFEPDKEPREIRGTAESVQSVSWLPDGRIVYVARCGHDAPIVCRDLYVRALDGTAPRNLTADLDGSLISGVDNPALARPLITDSGDALVTVARHFDQQLARIHLADGHVEWITSLPSIVKAVATNDGQTGYALLAARSGEMAAVYLSDARFASYTPLAVPELQPADWQPLHARHLQWSSENHVIDGLLYMPAAAAADQRVPLVVDVHGGPAGRFEDGDYPLVRLLLASGWAVLHVNPTGSFGYGARFLASLKDDLGGVDYRDIMRGVDAALAQAPIDKDRLAMIGYSYGATMTGFALGRTDRFRAMVAAAPVVDQISEYGTEDSSWYDRWYFGQPWRRLDAAWRQSPLAGVAAARTPLLLLHGESDPVNPLGQSLELYRALRQEGSPVELLLFPRETHRELGLNYYGFPSVEPKHGIALRQRILDFLADAFSGKPRAGLKE